MILAAARHALQLGADAVDVIARRRLPVQARQRDRGAAVGRAHAQAGLELALGVGEWRRYERQLEPLRVVLQASG